jgi:membrane fusion protein, heavy metal efflux system
MACFIHRPSVGSNPVAATLLGLLLILALPQISLAHAGHGEQEFQGGSQPTQTPGKITIDPTTAERMGFKIEPVSRQQLAIGIKTTGQIETQPNQQVEVTTPVGGTVLRLLVNPGESVSAGQAVAVMTSPELAELRTNALDRQSEAQGNRQQATAELQLAQENYQRQQELVWADIQQAEVALKVAQDRYDRDRELLTAGAIPRRTLLESESHLAEVKATVAKAKSQLPIAEATAQLRRAESAISVAESKLQLSQQTYEARLRQLGANANEDGTITIKAPISGTIADREATIGESGQDAGKKIMTIVNGNSILITANIYEKDLDKIQIGQSVAVKVNGHTKELLRGRISVIGATVQGDTRVVPVKAELANPDGKLKPGMFAELEVVTDRTLAAVLAIPKSAIVETNDQKKVVYVQNGNAFQAVEVSLGRESGDWVEVTNGVFDGDRIVTQRANQLYAQSLRSGNQKDDHHHDHDDASTSNKISLRQMLKWGMLPLGGLVIAGTFWAGSYWATRRQRHNPLISSEHPDDSYTAAENWPYATPPQPPVVPEADPEVAEPQFEQPHK